MKAAAALEEGKQRLRNKRWREAEEILLQALKFDNKLPDAYNLLARAQLRLGGKKAREALDNAKRAIMLDKENAEYYLTLGSVYEAHEDYAKAEQNYKLAWSWDPQNENAREALKDLRSKTRGNIFTRLLKKK